jgi:hypothetical protein
MPLASSLNAALAACRSQESFIQDVLVEQLNWPISEDVGTLEDISFGWSLSELASETAESEPIAGTILQLRPIRQDQPWGIFVLDFKDPNVLQAKRGVAGTLRRIVRGLVASRRKPSSQPSWMLNNLLFIGTAGFESFRFAWFYSTDDKPAHAQLRSFGWEADMPARTVCEYNLPMLEWPHEGVSAIEWTAQWAAAFSVEAVTNQFYDGYEATFAATETWVRSHSPGLTDEDSHSFCQLLLNRLLFLRFIEKKGFLKLDGETAYMHALFARAQREGVEFFHALARPLFFDGLGRRHTGSDVRFGDVPFLNGGLFEPGILDSKVQHIPNNILEPLVGADGLLYRYNFTVEESTPLDIEVAVDPEMLGKVFERLVTGRHSTGSYYTPRPIVSRMCRDAIKYYLSSRTSVPVEFITRLVDDHTVALNGKQLDEVRSALAALKAVDPACGSGAYLLGLLQELVAIWQCLGAVNEREGENSLVRLKLSIIANNLYGVDIDATAVNIAMLRLWLSFEVDSSIPLPLPNLDFKVEIGDSLTGPCPRDDQDWTLWKRAKIADELTELKGTYLTAHEEQKEQLRKSIRESETKLASEVASSGVAGFDWRVRFAEAFMTTTRAGNGFDIVVTNPPYVKKENLGADTIQKLESVYSETRQGKQYAWSDDLYVHFVFRAMDLLNERGIMAIIANDSFVGLESKERVRRLLLRNELLQLIRCPREAFDAMIYTAIFLAQKGPRTHSTYETGEFVAPKFEYSSLGPVALSLCDSLPHLRLTYASPVAGIYARMLVLKRLGEYVDVMDTGIHSGNVRDKLFFYDNPTGQWNRLIQGRQIQRYALLWDSPVAKFRYCNPEYEPLDVPGVGRKGSASKHNEYWGFCGPKSNHEKPERLLLRQSDDDLVVAYQCEQHDGRLYTDNTLFTLLLRPGAPCVVPLKYVMGVLNSTPMNAFYHFLSMEKGKTLAQVKVDLVRGLPLAIAHVDRVVQLVDEVLALTRNRSRDRLSEVQLQCNSLMHRIDDLVYSAYGLSTDDIAAIRVAEGTATIELAGLW